jgi:tetratricopeptide (TPR) repeat protein
MKRFIITFLVFSFFLASATSQRVKKEKVEIRFQTEPLVDLKTKAETFYSNSIHLNLYGIEKTESNPDLIVLNNVFPAARLSNWWLEDPSTFDASMRFDKTFYSQPYTLTVKDKDRNIIFHRVYNIFDAESGEPMNGYLEPELSVQVHLSRELSYLFSQNFEPKFDIKLFYVKKSDEHDDINSAFEDAMKAISLHNEKKYEKADLEFEKALKKWMNALNEKNLSDRKARINEKVTKGLYQNIIQVLAILEKYEKADELMESAREEIGGFYNLALNGHQFLLDNLKMITMGKNGASDFKFVDLEYDESVKPMIQGERPMKPESPADIRNLLAGSWRYMCITKNDLPTTNEDFNPKNRKENLLGDDREQILHLNPNGTSIDQKGAWEESQEQLMNGGFSGFWRYIPGPKNKFFLMFAMEEEDFENTQENYNLLEIMDVYSINDKKLILRVPNYNPDVDARAYYVQFQRITGIL